MASLRLGYALVPEHQEVHHSEAAAATVRLGMDTYSHTLPSMGAEAAERLDALLAANS